MMARQAKLISLQEAEAIARAATNDALAKHPKASWYDDPNLTLGTFFPDERRYEFSLYLAAERPSDGLLLTTAVVDRATGNVEVTVHAPPQAAKP